MPNIGFEWPKCSSLAIVSFLVGIVYKSMDLYQFDVLMTNWPRLVLMMTYLFTITLGYLKRKSLFINRIIYTFR